MGIGFVEVFSQIFMKNGFDIFYGSFRSFQLCPFGQFKFHDELAGFCLRHKFTSDRRYQQEGCTGKHHAYEDNNPFYFQDFIKKFPVGSDLDGTFFYRGWLVFVKTVIQHRDQEDGNKQRGEEREGYSPCLVLKQLSGCTMQIYNGQEYHDGGESGSGDGTPYFSRSIDGSLFDRHPVFMVSENILDDNNGIVNQHTGSQRKSSQGHDVDGKVVEIHQVKGGYDRDGHGNADDQSITNSAEKDEKHENSQKDTHKCRFFHFNNGFPDKLALVGDCGQLITRQRSLDFFQGFVDLFHRLHGIITGFLINGKADTPFSIKVYNIGGFFIAESDSCDILQEDRSHFNGRASGRCSCDCLVPDDQGFKI